MNTIKPTLYWQLIVKIA